MSSQAVDEEDVLGLFLQQSPTTNSSNLDEYSHHSDLSHNQYSFMVLSLWAGSILNVVGSIIILYSVWLRRQRWTVYHRLLMIMSIFEVFNGMNWIGMPFLNLRGTPGLYWALGNTDTCTLNGFLTVTLLLPTWIYSGYLSIYFLLIIRYHWTEQQISKRFEVPAFFIAVGISLTGSINGVMTESFNSRPSELLCLTDVYPYNCREDPDVDCERGQEEGGALVGWVIVLTAVVSSIVGLVCTCTIYCTVYITYLNNNNNNNQNHSSTLSSCFSSDRRLKVVAKQSGLYFLIYLNFLMWPLLTELIYGISNVSLEDDRGSSISYVYDVISWFFFPLQGFLNCCVYLRPRYDKWRAVDDNNNNGRIWAIGKAIGTDPLPPKKATHHKQHQSADFVSPSMNNNNSNSSSSSSSSSNTNKQEEHIATATPTPGTATRFVSSSSSTKSWRSYPVWFPFPEIFPYHISAGFSVGPGISSSSDNDDPAISSCVTMSDVDITIVEQNNEHPRLQKIAADAVVYNNDIQKSDNKTNHHKSANYYPDFCSCAETEPPSDELQENDVDDGCNDPEIFEPAALLSVGQPELLFKTDKEQQIDQIVE